MKKKTMLFIITMATLLGLSGCGEKELVLVSDKIQVELGSELDAAVATYVQDEKMAEQAAIDFSEVNVMVAGTYDAAVTYKEQAVVMKVAVTDTTAPVVESVEKAVVAVNEPLYVEDVIANVTELSGTAAMSFEESESPAEKTAETPATEPFVCNGVMCSNDFITFVQAGEYDTLITVTDVSGNSVEVPVHVIVGEAPTIAGVADITVTAGADEVDYLSGITAVDFSGKDITDKIICDFAAVDLTAAGEYSIIYTVTDESGFAAKETAMVKVEEKSSKKSAGTSTNSSKKNSIAGSTTTSGTAAPAGSSNTGNTNTGNTNTGNASGANTNTGNTNTGNTNTGNAAGDNASTGNINTGNTSGGNTNTENTNTGNTSGGNTSAGNTTPTTPPPSTGDTMSVPDDVVIEDYDSSTSVGTGGVGGGNVTDGGNW